MKTVKLKYSFDKNYFYNKMISVPYIEKCLYCENGKYKRVGDGKIVKCPVCKGVGEYDSGSGSIKEEPNKCKLIKVIITSDDIEYQFIDKENKVIFGNVYETIEECAANKSKGIMGYTK